jgi:transcriptional regulator with XRE-family HTH domain
MISGQDSGPGLRGRRRAGRRLARMRSDAGLSQLELGRRIGYARSTIGEAESAGSGALMLWRRADDELAAGGELVRLHAAARAAEAAGQDAAAGQRLLRLPAAPAADGDGAAAGSLPGADGTCPHCGTALVLRAQLTSAGTGPQAAITIGGA